ncbi:uncharacterized protein LOC108676723, partial [Hyalella azteca]|uniref:Uncharacterized protein LOC108676723 n=1 Tax=Hyalella azteca TaxID=294128 RepID=A0A8B7P2U2_HYAAZ
TAQIIRYDPLYYVYVYAQHGADNQRLGSKFASELDLMFGAPFSDVTTPPTSSRSYHNSPGPYSNSPESYADKPGSYGTSRQHLSRPEFGFQFEDSVPSVVWVSTSNYTRNDAHVSEILMKLWSTFARSGTPNGQESSQPNFSYPERSRFKNLTWQKYDPVYENYLEISSRPRMRDHYRAHQVALWNWLLPELQLTSDALHDEEARSWHHSDDPDYFVGPVRPLDPYRFLKATPASFTSPLPMLPNPRNEFLGPNISATHGVGVSRANISTSGQDSERNPLLDYTTALTLTVAIGLSLLVLNVMLFAALLYRRERSQMGSKITYDSVSVQPLCTVDSGIRGAPGTTQGSITPPGKEVLVATTCTADIQVTELRTFPTPPDIGDRNTEVTSYTAGPGKRNGCSALSTSQFIPPPPLQATSTASQHALTDSDINSSLGTSVVMGTPGPPCTAGGLCSLSPGHQVTQFPTTSVSYCPPPQYCNEFPVSQYSPNTYNGSSSCQFSNPNQFPSPTNCGGGNLSLQRNSGTSAPQRSATLNRSGGPNSVCLVNSRKPKPPRRDSSSSSVNAGSTFATLPRQSSLDSSSHIIA